MISAMYLISRHGVPITSVFSDNRVEDITETTLFSGILSAIQTAMIELDVGVPKRIESKKQDIYLELIEKAAIAIICDKKTVADRELMNNCLKKFIESFQSKFTSINDFTIIKDEKISEIKTFLEKYLEEMQEELCKSRSTKLISDSFW